MDMDRTIFRTLEMLSKVLFVTPLYIRETLAGMARTSARIVNVW